jgi:hypothetical protein
MIYSLLEIPGFEGYYADTNGDIWSAWKLAGSHGTRRTFIDTDNMIKMNPKITKFGYKSLTLYRDRKKHDVRVNRLIALTFIENPLNHPCVCHNDNDPLNNAVENLRWDTHKGNTADMKKFGTFVEGSKSGMAKLTEDKVISIRQYLADGLMNGPTLAKQFGVDRQTIWKIQKNLIWRHI